MYNCMGKILRGGAKAPPPPPPPQMKPELQNVIDYKLTHSSIDWSELSLKAMHASGSITVRNPDCSVLCGRSLVSFMEMNKWGKN